MSRNIELTRSDRIFNNAVRWLAKMGISMMGTRLLAVRGRKTGEWRTTAVNLLTYSDSPYLVAPRGQTQWVKNIRVAGGGELRLGWRKRAFTVTELADEDKPEIFRLYLKKWAWEVGKFFGDGINADSSTAKLLEVAPDFPVFKVHFA
jgi:deazaflavin-dependent oxidoreductase (nitroreductase family)